MESRGTLQLATGQNLSVGYLIRAGVQIDVPHINAVALIAIGVHVSHVEQIRRKAAAERRFYRQTRPQWQLFSKDEKTIPLWSKSRCWQRIVFLSRRQTDVLFKALPMPASASRCDARTRGGNPCQSPAIRDRRRCRLHGGLITGPRPAERLARIRQANTRHGRYSREQMELRREMRRFQIPCFVRQQL